MYIEYYAIFHSGSIYLLAMLNLNLTALESKFVAASLPLP